MADREEADDAGRHERDRRPYAIVGIGAAAPLAPALLELLGELDEQRTACVVIEHAVEPAPAAGAPGSLAAVLGEHFGDRLRAADDGVTIEREKIYLTEAGAEVSLFQGVFHVMPAAQSIRTPRQPIDFFLRALASDQGASGIGVLLSGTSPDGWFGLQAIKADGGVTFMQRAPGDAAASDGPTELAGPAETAADFVLAPLDIAAEVNKISRQLAPANASANDSTGTASAASSMRSGRPGSNEKVVKLFSLVRSAFGTDLHSYKRSTIERRIGRRMIVTRIETLEDYVDYVESRPAELESLYKDCLIGVTSFFRDHEPFEALKSTVLPRILGRKAQGAPLRIWVPGCASGEEAYSVAMCMFELLEGKAFEAKIQIFATDLDADAINAARRGIYPPNIAHDVSPARLERFFVRLDGNFQVSRRIRDIVVFAIQDVTRGPPFSRIDLISCRNLLIYLQPTIQKKVLRVFHYALATEGTLILGTSESIGDSADLFTVIDKEQRIYGKKNAPSAAVFDMTSGSLRTARPESRVAPVMTRPILTLQQQADRKVLEKYGPPGVLINEDMDVLQFRGRVGFFLEPTPGNATLNLLKLARPELLPALRASVGRCLHENVPVSIRGIELLGEDGSSVHIEVLPLEEPETRNRCLLVLFEVASQSPAAPRRPADAEPVPAQQRNVEGELVAMQEYLQQTVEELETANEELQSSNEELQSSNEELQSSNEELETSKEELQSTNEELNTVNDELESRMGELSLASDDLFNFMGISTEPVVIVGLDLRIRRFSSSAERLLGLAPGDTGRTVRSLAPFFVDLDLEPPLVEAIDTVTEQRKEALGTDGCWYRVRIKPYKTADQAIRGALLVFAEVETADRHGPTTGRSPPKVAH